MKPAAAILHHLRLHSATGCPEENLVQHLGLTPLQIRKEIEALKLLGIPIIEEPFYGFRLLFQLPDILFSEIIESYLESSFWRVLIYRETASTNDLVNQFANRGELEGLVIFAESQTQGRGRSGRQWESEPNLGLWFSLLLRPYWNVACISRLTIIAAAAVIKGIEAVTDVKLQIKWPNDILLNHKKLGGILTEAKVYDNQIHCAIIGIGININHLQENFSPSLQSNATSLKRETGQSYTRAEIAASILNQFDKFYLSDFEQSRELWLDRCITLNQMVTLATATGQITGRAESIAEEGSLLIRDSYGYLQGINSGEVIS